MSESAPRTTKHIKSHLWHPCKIRLYSTFTCAKKGPKTGCQFGAQQNSVPSSGYVPPQMFHSAFAAFGHSKSASATAFPPIVLWRRENDRDSLFTTIPSSLLPVLAWGKQRVGVGDIGAAAQLRRVRLGAPSGTEGQRMELRFWASRILNPPGGWSPLSTPILSFSL